MQPDVNRYYFGRVTDTWTAGHDVYSSLEPLWVATANGAAWERALNANDLARFEKKQRVLWFTPSFEQKNGACFLFKLHDSGVGKPDRYRVNQFTLRVPNVAIDLERFPGGEEAALTQLRDGTLIGSSLADTWRLRFPDDWWSEPLDLSSGRLAGKYRSDVVICRHWASLAGAWREMPDRPWLLILAPECVPAGRMEQRDIAPGHEVIRHVLDNAAASVKAFEGKRLAEAVPLLLDQLKTDQDAGVWAWRYQRAKRLLGQPASDFVRKDAIASLLLEGPWKAELERQMTTAVDVAMTGAEAEIRRRKEEAQREIAADKQAAQEELSALAKERKTLEQEIAGQRKKQAELIDAFDKTLTGRLTEVRERPAAFLAEVALLRAALSPEGHRQAALGRLAPAEITGFSKAEDVKTVLDLMLAQQDAPIAHAAGLIAALLCGAMPMLAGSRADQSLVACGRAIAGGRVTWLPVSPTMLEPADLIARPERRLVPHPAGLADVLLAAREDDGLFLVVLEGLNRAAVDSYLIPLLRARAAGRDLALFATEALDHGDPRAGLCRFTWPDNVLLAATASQGAACLPLPPAILEHGVLIATDALPDPPDPLPTPRSATCVARQRWREWREAASKLDAVAAATTWPGALSLGLRRHREQLYRAARFVGSAHDAALTVVSSFAMLPLASAKWQGSPTVYPDVNRALEQLRLLTG